MRWGNWSLGHVSVGASGRGVCVLGASVLGADGLGATVFGASDLQSYPGCGSKLATLGTQQTRGIKPEDRLL